MPPKNSTKITVNQGQIILFTAILQELNSSVLTMQQWERVGSKLQSKDGKPVSGVNAQKRFNRLAEKWKQEARKAQDEYDKPAQSGDDEEAPVRRGRGRPKKEATVKAGSDENTAAPIKKGPGRPRKPVSPAAEEDEEEDERQIPRGKGKEKAAANPSGKTSKSTPRKTHATRSQSGEIESDGDSLVEDI